MAVICDLCGARAEGDTPPVTWVVSFEQGRRQVFCEPCARANLRSIEGRLDSAWW